MSRDKVKTEMADAIRRAIRHTASGMAHSLKAQGVQDAEVERVSELETQIRVSFKGIPPRYFLVKVSEKL